jgi:hypothetical protein
VRLWLEHSRGLAHGFGGHAVAIMKDIRMGHDHEGVLGKQLGANIETRVAWNFSTRACCDPELLNYACGRP